MAADPGIEHEPHLRGSLHVVDPSEARADVTLGRRRASPDDDVAHVVWDEPTLDRATAGIPAEAVTYSRWLAQKHSTTTTARSWGYVGLLILAAGPWALLSSLLHELAASSISAFITMVVMAPLIEEMMKASLPLITIEKRPYLFRSGAQILLCCAASGLVFALIENQIYFRVYADVATPLFVQWRNSVCVVLHVGCAVIAGMGLRQMWRDTTRDRTRPRTATAARYLTIAAIVHGSYNALAMWMESVLPFHTGT